MNIFAWQRHTVNCDTLIKLNITDDTSCEYYAPMRGRLCRSNSGMRNSAIPPVNAQDDLPKNQDNLLSTDRSSEIHGKSK